MTRTIWFVYATSTTQGIDQQRKFYAALAVAKTSIATVH